jgi:TetR/AcrR family fatty acid metabolism transcriptional regulator
LIMSAAERLFRSRRFHEIKLDDVAREAKVGKGTIYLYFRDKDDLFFQTTTNGLDELCSLLTGIGADGSSFNEELTLACAKISDFFAGRRELFGMMEDEDARAYLSRGNVQERWLEKRRPIVEAVSRIMQKGIASGSVRQDIDPEILAHFFLGMLRTRARDISESPASRDNTAFVDLFVNGVRRI